MVGGLRAAGVAASLVLCLMGCTTVGGRQFSVDAARQIHTGVTDKAGVQSLLGPPYSRNSSYGNETWQYMYTRVSAAAGAQAFIPVIGPFLPGAASTSTDMRMVMISFDGGVVSKCTITVTSNTSSTGGGLAGELMGSGTQSTDVSDCSKP